MKKVKFFEDLTVKKIKNEIIYWETNGYKDAKVVGLLELGHEPGEDIHTYDNGKSWYEYFYATIIINNDVYHKLYELDCQKGCIVTSMDADTDE